MHWSWKQVCDKWSKVKDKYEIEKKKMQMTGASLFDWPWFERFDQMVHRFLIGHGLRDLTKCLEAQPRLMAFLMQLIRECKIYIHILRFKLLR